VILFTVIVSFIASAFFKKINVYDAFIEGAKEGFSVAINIIPYLVAILVGIGVFRVSGALNIVVEGLGAFFGFLGFQYGFCSGFAGSINDAAQWRRCQGNDGGYSKKRTV
jgi:spore maturation protein SpmB